MTTSNDTSATTRGTGSRVWLITGASSGFGQAIAEAALQTGDTVVATARRSAAVDSLVTAHPERALGMALDVTDTDGIAKVVSDVLRHVGRRWGTTPWTPSPPISTASGEIFRRGSR